MPTENPDQLSLFKSRQLDAVWTVEPWVSRLETEAGGKVLVEERNAITTVLVARAGFLGEQRELVRGFVAAHRELTDWINAHPAEAQKMVRAETQGRDPHRFLARADRACLWPHVLTSEVSLEPFKSLRRAAQKVGFLRGAPDLVPPRGDAVTDGLPPHRRETRRPKLVVEHVSKWFRIGAPRGAGARRCLADGRRSGEFVCLVGPSGLRQIDAARHHRRPDRGRITGEVLADGRNRSTAPGASGW